MSQLSTEKKLNHFIFKISIFITLSAKKLFCWSKFLIHCEAHCQKFENSNIYNLKTAKDILKIPMVLSSGDAKATFYKK